MILLKNVWLPVIFFIMSIIRDNVNCANILGLMCVPSPSHQLWNSVLINALANRGHNLTILSVDLPKNPKKTPKNVHYIHLEETYNYMYNTDNKLIDITDFIDIGPIEVLPTFYSWYVLTCIGVTKSKGIDVLLNYPDNFKFDVILHDYTAGSCLLGFADKFKNVPIIGISAFHLYPMINQQVGGHSYPGYIPFHGTVFPMNMTFWQRIYNNVIYLMDELYRRHIANKEVDKVARTKFPNMPYLEDIEKRTVLVLVNSHPAVHYPEPTPPNVIEVGGMQITDPKPLPAELENFISNSKNGAIFFSLGTNMHPEHLGLQKIKIILDTMSQLPQYNFLWKFDIKAITSKLPENVLIKPFFPQRDILAHPKLKAFVTHAGGLSTQEATWCGVPMIGLAIFVDQPSNLLKSILAGVAEKVDFLTLNVETLKSTILKVAEDKKYAENMKIRSARFRDRPIRPLDTAIWWVEYIIRNPNPTHLRSPTIEIGFIASNSLDFVLIIIALISLIIYLVLKIIWCICCRADKGDKFVKKNDRHRKKD